MILGSVGRGYCKKNTVLEFLAKTLGEVDSALFNQKNPDLVSVLSCSFYKL